MTIAVDDEVSEIRRIYNEVRAKAVGYLGSFLRTPLAWVLLAGIVGALAWQAELRAGNRLICAATSQTVDTQYFREAVAGDGTAGGGRLFYQACAGMATPGPNWQALARQGR
jgi:hypothetical protein